MISEMHRLDSYIRTSECFMQVGFRKKKGTLKEKCNIVPPLMGIIYRLVCIHYTLSISKIFLNPCTYVCMYVYMNLYVYVYVTIYLSSNYLSMIYFGLAPF